MAHVLGQFIAQQHQRLAIEIGENQIRSQLALLVNLLQRSAPELEIVLIPVLFGIVSCTIHRNRVAFHSEGQAIPSRSATIARMPLPAPTSSTDSPP